MRLATVSRLVDLWMERLTLGKKIIRALICAIHAYVCTCVLAYVRTHVRMSTHMMFSHVSLPTQRSLRVAAIPSRVAVPWFAACTHVACTHVCMCACTHIWVRVWCFPSVSLPTHRSLRVAIPQFTACFWPIWKTNLFVRLTCAATTAHNYGSKQNKQIFLTKLASECEEKSNQNRKKSGQKPSIRTCVHVHTYILYLV